MSSRASVLRHRGPGLPPSCPAASFVCVHSGINCKPIAGPVRWPAGPSVPGESHCSPGLGERQSEGKPFPAAAAGEGAALRRGIQSDWLDCPRHRHGARQPKVGWGHACECWKRDKFCLLNYSAAAECHGEAACPRAGGGVTLVWMGFASWCELRRRMLGGIASLQSRGWVGRVNQKQILCPFEREAICFDQLTSPLGVEESDEPVTPCNIYGRNLPANW